MNAAEVRKVTEKVLSWAPDDQLWWRELLEHHPEEALVVAALIVETDARPVQEEEDADHQPAL